MGESEHALETGGLQMYCRPVVVRAGETVTVHGHAEERCGAALTVRRLWGPSERPDLVGAPAEPVDWWRDRRVSCEPQATHAGSYVRAPVLWPSEVAGATIDLGLRASAPDGADRQVLLDVPGWLRLEVASCGDGALALAAFAADGDDCALASLGPLLRDEWYQLTLRWASRELAIDCRAQSGWLAPRALHATGTLAPPAAAPEEVAFGARLTPAGYADRCFDGSVDYPAIWAARLDDGEVARLGDGAPPATVRATALLGAWHFGRAVAERGVANEAGGAEATVVNRPARAVPSRLWSDASPLFAEGDRGYSAVHLHADDLEDAGWEPLAELAIPLSCPSGVYAAVLRSDAGGEHAPFIVVPEARRERVAVVLPTMTYLAYANMHFDEQFVAMQRRVSGGRAVELSPRERAVGRVGPYGKSVYDVHDDGSPVYYSAWARPIQELRADYRNGLLRVPRHFSGDLVLLDWLRERGVAFDVLADDVLHERADALDGYRVAITGSHPEYASREVIDAYGAYIAGGGRVMYLGGNGFYWVTGRQRDGSGIEVRRGMWGPRQRAQRAGELVGTTTLAPGGLWRHRGRAPHATFGVGCAGLGWVDAAGYRRVASPGAARADFVLEGVERDPFAVGGAMGGAAGDEVDRCDPHFGSPHDAIVVASSRGLLSRHYQPLPEDEEQITPDRDAAHNDNVRADMTLSPHPSGGAVFATGSLAWTIGLWSQARDPDVDRVTGNVLDRFLRDEPI